MDYYIRATGVNKYAGGTDKWLKIRNVERKAYGYEIEVRIKGQRRFVGIRGNGPTQNLEFAKGWPGLQPVSYRRVIEGMG